MIIKKEDIENFETRYRTTLINSLAGFRQAVLVGTKSTEGHTNLAIFNSLIHLGSFPACFGLVSRPDKVPRDTLQNILDTKEYTLNYVSSAYYQKAHQTSARYAKDVSEFEEAGFDEMYEANIYPPFVKEGVVKIAMKFEETIPIRLNGTILIIGSVQHIHINETLIEEDGFVSLSDADILISQGLDAYYISKKVGRLPYAKP